MKVYLAEDLPTVKKHKETIAALSAEMIIHANKGRFDKRDYQISKIAEAIASLKELHLKAR